MPSDKDRFFNLRFVISIMKDTEEEYEVTDVGLTEEQMEDWIKKLEELTRGHEHIHLLHDKGEVLAHLSEKKRKKR